MPIHVDISTSKFESLLSVHSVKDHNWASLISVLNEFESILSKVVFVDSPVGRSECQRINTLIANIIIRFFVSDNLSRPTKNEFLECLLLNRFIAAVFEISGYRGLSTIRTLLVEKIKAMKNNVGMVSKETLSLSVVLLSNLNYGPKFVGLLEGLPDDLKGPSVLTFVSQRSVLTERAEDTRNALFKFFLELQPARLPEGLRNIVLSAWMYCTYSSSPLKHKFKEHLNNFIKVTWTLKLPSVQRSNFRSMSVLVLSERAKSTHAMHRVYASDIEHLKNSGADLIYFGRRADSDPDGLIFFSRFYFLEDYADLQTALNALFQKEQPALAWFPSVGMSFWSIVLANHRLPCKTVYSLGHPAPAATGRLDYVLLPEIPIIDYSEFHEQKIIGDVNQGPDQFKPSSLLKPGFIDSLLAKRKSNERKTVLVNAQVMKLCPFVIEVLKDISALNDNVDIQFCPGEASYRLNALSSEIGNYIERYKVAPKLRYPDFLELLSKATLSIVPPVFGSTNSLVDCVLLGIPFVALRSSRIEGYQSEYVATYFNCPPDLIVDTEEEYKSIVNRLLTSNEYCLEVSDKILSSPRRRRLLEQLTESSLLQGGGMYGHHIMDLITS